VKVTVEETLKSLLIAVISVLSKRRMNIAQLMMIAGLAITKLSSSTIQIAIKQNIARA
jgi:hypothetical protein